MKFRQNLLIQIVVNWGNSNRYTQQKIKSQVYFTMKNSIFMSKDLKNLILSYSFEIKVNTRRNNIRITKNRGRRLFHEFY